MPGRLGPQRPCTSPYQGAGRYAADQYGAAAAAACVPVRAGLPPGAAAAVRAACPVPDALAAAAAVRTAAVDMGRRYGDVARYDLRPPVDRRPVQPRHYGDGDVDGGPSVWHLAPGDLCDVFLEDLGRLVRPAVDLLPLATPASPREDEGYEHARGTWADDAAAEKADVSSTQRYIDAINAGGLDGDMLPGRELPGSPFNGRRTCGLPTTLGHIGDEASGHDGAAVLKRGEMSCDGRGCMRCWVRGWMGGEARGMARKLSGGVARARLADGGAAGGRRTPVLHIVISLPPEGHAAWAYGGPAERARIRKAALAELHRRGRSHAKKFLQSYETPARLNLNSSLRGRRAV